MIYKVASKYYNVQVLGICFKIKYIFSVPFNNHKWKWTSPVYEPGREISKNVVCATSKASDQPAHTCSLIRAFASLKVKLLTEHHLEFLILTGGCTGSSESTLVKMPHCWKLHVMVNIRMG